MAHQRGMSGAEAMKEPHSVSLKVLRLSRPTLSIQHPLPLCTPVASHNKTNVAIQEASHAYPSSKPDAFILSPLLTLPPAFGSAYVGETFSCTLCANNEILPGSTVPKGISNVRIEAEMKIPSSATPKSLVLGLAQNADKAADEKMEIPELDPGKSLQKIVNFDLKEEGSHVLAVTVTYTETTPTSGRVRTFRKLYQFVCKSCMMIRTKSSPLPTEAEKGKKWALEAQLENTGEEIYTLEGVIMETKEGFRSTGLNWEADGGEKRLVLMPGDVQQVCFLVEQLENHDEPELVDGRLEFGILTLSWRGQMGNRGFLSTGTLGARLRS